MITCYIIDSWSNSAKDGDRRIIRPNILSLFAKKLKLNGFLRIATDVEDYVQHIYQVINMFNDSNGIDTIDNNDTIPKVWKVVNAFEHIAGEDLPCYRPITKYEIKAHSEGRKVWEIEFQLSSI